MKNGYETHKNGLVRIAKVEKPLSGYVGYCIEEKKDGKWVRGNTCPWDYLGNARGAMRKIANGEVEGYPFAPPVTPDGLYIAKLHKPSGGSVFTKVKDGKWFFIDGTGWCEPFAEGELPASFHPAPAGWADAPAVEKK